MEHPQGAGRPAPPDGRLAVVALLCMPSRNSLAGHVLPLPPSRLAQETHAVALRKQEQMAKLKSAFGFGEDEVREGDAFNRELQEQKRQERIAEREAKEEERRWVGGGPGGRSSIWRSRRMLGQQGGLSCTDWSRPADPPTLCKCLGGARAQRRGCICGSSAACLAPEPSCAVAAASALTGSASRRPRRRPRRLRRSVSGMRRRPRRRLRRQPRRRRRRPRRRKRNAR